MSLARREAGQETTWPTPGCGGPAHESADKIIEKYNKKERDIITGEPVSKKTKDAAQFGKKWFEKAEKLKSGNDEASFQPVEVGDK